MPRPPPLAIAPLVTLLLWSAPAATAPLSPRYTFSGFGTLGYAALDEPGAEYRSGKGGDGADEDGSFELDSRLGLQLDAELTTRLSATVQGVAREDEDGEPGAELEWAFLSWPLGDSAMLRAGRLALPMFAVSDYREVGYANTTVRPPEDVYVQIPLRRYDGVEIGAGAELGETLLGVQLGTGRSRGVANAGLEADAEDAVALILSAERGPFRLRLGRLWSRLLLDDRGDIAALRDGIERAAPFVPGLSALADDFSLERRPMSFDAIGLGYDDGRAFVEAEYTRRRADSWALDVDSWYVVVGTRLGAFTPYALVSAFRDVYERPAIELPALPALEPLGDGLDAFYASRDQDTIGLGLRWDLAPRVALKFQAERISREDVGVSFEADRSVSARNARRDDGDDVTLFAVTLDFIF